MNKTNTNILEIPIRNRKQRRTMLAKFKKSMRRIVATEGAFGKTHNDIMGQYNIEKNKENKDKHTKK